MTQQARIVEVYIEFDLEQDLINGIMPEIIHFSERAVPHLNESHFICSCDIAYLDKHPEAINSVTRTQGSPPLVLAIYINNPSREKVLHTIKHLNSSLKNPKLSFLLYHSRILSSQKTLSHLSKEEQKKIHINYIKNARFALIGKIWHQNQILKDGNVWARIIDADFKFTRNPEQEFQHLTKTLPHSTEIILAWDSHENGQLVDFTTSLSSLTPAHKTIHYPCHMLIKAGFCAVKKGQHSLNFLSTFAFNSFSPFNAELERRIFTHYYGDQISLLFTINDMRANDPDGFNNYLKWVDISNSNLVSIQGKHNPAVHLMKSGLFS